MVANLGTDFGYFILLCAPKQGTQDPTVTTNDATFGDDNTHFWLIDQFKAILSATHVETADNLLLRNLNALTLEQTKSTNLAKTVVDVLRVRKEIDEARQRAARLAAQQTKLQNKIGVLLKTERMLTAHHFQFWVPSHGGHGGN